MKIFAAALVCAALAASRPARADDVVAYQADGDAAAGAADARVEALDEAFGKAVAQALGDVLDAETRKQNKAVLDRELIGHARLWVARFAVTREAVADDRKQLSVSVRIDRDKLRARLTELGIAVQSVARGEAPAAAAQTATVLLRVAGPDGVHATYGLAAEKEVAGLAAAAGALRRASFAVQRAPAAGPAARADGDLPLDDDTADALADQAKADVAAVIGVTVGAPVPLRGIDVEGVLVTAHVRLIESSGSAGARSDAQRSGGLIENSGSAGARSDAQRRGGINPKAHRAIGQSVATSIARGTAPGVVDYAIDHAVLSALTDVMPQQGQPVAAPVFRGEDTLVSEPGIVLVRLARATSWGLVQAELKHLLGARGVTTAALRHVSPAGWVIGVATGESIDRIASIVKKPPAADTSVAVKIAGEIVEATLSGAP